MTLRLFVLPFALLAAACGGSSDSVSSCKAPAANVETLLPASGAATGWTIDAASKYSQTNCAPERPIPVGMDNPCIDGSADPFVAKGCTAFAGQQYTKGTEIIELWTFENADSCKAKALYDYLPTCGAACSSLYDVSFETVAGVGDGARIADTGTRWWVNAWVGAYYFEFKLRDSSSPGGTVASEKQDAIDFAKAVATKMSGG